MIGGPWPDRPTTSEADAPSVAPPPSGDEGTGFTAPPDVASPPGGGATALSRYDQRTHQAVAPGATMPGDSTAASPIDLLEVACNAWEPTQSLLHAYGYIVGEEVHAITVCGLPADDLEAVIGGVISCPACSLGRSILVPPWAVSEP